MKTNRFLRLATVVAAAAFLTTSCDKYESEFSGRLDDLEDRVTTLEEATAALKTRMDAGALIKSVTPITAAPGGWRIEFTGGSPAFIDLMNGEAGSNPDPVPGTPGVTPMLKVETVDGVTTLWVDYGDGEGWIDTGTPIQGPQGDKGPQGIQGPQGDPGTPAVPPIFKVEGNTVWYNVTHTNGDPDTGTWVNTETSIQGQQGIQGPQGDPGTPAVPPIFKVEGNTVWYNVTHTGGDPDTGIWVNTGTSIKGDTGTPGTNGNYPLLDVRKDIVTGKITVWYNVTHTNGDGETGTWVDTEYDISATGPVSAILPNGNGTVTIKMSDETEYVFGLFSTAQSFVIMNTQSNGGVTAGTVSKITFRVNPSNAYVPVSAVTAELGRWSLDQIATRAGYITPSDYFHIVSIMEDGDKDGQYVATIVCDKSLSEDAISEYDMALVLNNNSGGTTDSFISSNPFTFAEKQLTGFALDPEFSLERPVNRVVSKNSILQALIFTPADVSNKEFTMASSNENIVSVGTPGLVTEGVGTAKITVTHTASGMSFDFDMEVVPVTAEEVTLNETELSLPVNETSGLQAIVNPSSTTDKAVTWLSSDPNIVKATVVSGGSGTVASPWKVILEPLGTAGQSATITVTNTASGETASCIVTIAAARVVPEFVTIGGADWATKNLADGKAFVDEYWTVGYQYQFNSTTAWDPYTIQPTFLGTIPTITANWDMAANNPCPEGYVVPTRDQYQALVAATDYIFTTVNGVSGARLVDKGDPAVSIFLPTMGQRSSTSKPNANVGNGYYWTSTYDGGPEMKYNITFYSGSFKTNSGSSATSGTANNIRCVKE